VGGGGGRREEGSGRGGRYGNFSVTHQKGKNRSQELGTHSESGGVDIEAHKETGKRIRTNGGMPRGAHAKINEERRLRGR
jgi:hypothetical protein